MFPVNKYKLVEGKRERDLFKFGFSRFYIQERNQGLMMRSVKNKPDKPVRPFFCLRVVFHVTIINKKKKIRKKKFDLFLLHIIFFCVLGVCGLFPRQIDGQSLMGLEENLVRVPDLFPLVPF